MPWSRHGGLPFSQKVLRVRRSRRGSTLQTTRPHSPGDRSRSAAAGSVSVPIYGGYLSSRGRRANEPPSVPRQPRPSPGSEERNEEIAHSIRSVPGCFVWQGGLQSWVGPPELLTF